MWQATSDDGAVPVREGEEVTEPAAYGEGVLHLEPKSAKSIGASLVHIDFLFVWRLGK